jgi:hypothetical protein
VANIKENKMKKSELKTLVKESIEEIREEDAMIQRGKNVYDAIIKNRLQNIFKTMTHGTEFPSNYNPKDSDMQVKLNKFAVDYKRAGGDLNLGVSI